MNVWSNIVRGVAFGDSWGDPNEFRSIDALVKDNAMGPGLPKHLRITDDTQMTLYLAAALDDSWGQSEDEVKRAIMEAFLTYRDDPDNNRAPGATVMGSLGSLSRTKLDWKAATSKGSDGCGTVMRATPTAFLPEDIWVGVTAFAAAVTHGTANGIASAILNVALLRDIIAGKAKEGQLTERAWFLARNAEKLGLLDTGTWLEDFMTAEQLNRGFGFLCTMLAQMAQELPKLQGDPWAFKADPSLQPSTSDGGMRGGGWRAHSCLGAAILAVDMLPGKPFLALRRAVTTDGDSDSIGAVAGGLIGALYPNCFLKVWDEGFRDRFETRYINWIELESDDYPFEPQGKGWFRKLVSLVR